MMKKLFLYIFLIPLVLASCKKENEPQPEEIRSYCSILSLVKQDDNITWVVDGVEVQNEQVYGSRILGAVLLDTDAQEISFTAENSSSGSVIESLLLTMQKDKHYLILLYGTADDPLLEVKELEDEQPQSGYIRFQFLHASPDVDSVDVFMGGTEVDDRVINNMNFGEFSEPFEVIDYKARASVTVAIHDETYDPENEILNYDYNDLIVSGTSYLSILAYEIGDPSDTAPKLWLYDLPRP
jgi:hypothetical protein